MYVNIFLHDMSGKTFMSLSEPQLLVIYKLFFCE